MTPDLPSDFANVLATWPVAAATRFHELRKTLWEVAARTGAAPLEESLKWGQPAWRPVKPRVGSTLRAWWSADDPDRLTLYVNCQTTLATDIDRACPDRFELHGNRGLSHRLAQPMPQQAIETCAEMTLTYFKSQRS